MDKEFRIRIGKAKRLVREQHNLLDDLASKYGGVVKNNYSDSHVQKFVPDGSLIVFFNSDRRKFTITQGGVINPSLMVLALKSIADHLKEEMELRGTIPVTQGEP